MTHLAAQLKNYFLEVALEPLQPDTSSIDSPSLLQLPSVSCTLVCKLYFNGLRTMRKTRRQGLLRMDEEGILGREVSGEHIGTLNWHGVWNVERRPRYYITCGYHRGSILSRENYKLSLEL